MSRIQTKWDLNILEPDKFEKFRKIIQEKVDKFESRWIKQKEYIKDPKKLKQAIEDFEDLLNYFYPSNEQRYYQLAETLDLKNQEIKAKAKLANDFINEISIKLRPFGSLISKIQKATQEKLLKDSTLKKYHTYLQGNFKNAKYRLSNKEEKIIVKLSDFAYSGWEKMVDSLINSEQVELRTNKKLVSVSELSKYFEDPKQEVREAAAIALHEITSKHETVAENEMNNILGYHKAVSELRKVKRSDELRHASDDIESTTADAMLEVIRNNLQIPQKYYTWKKKQLKLDKMYYYDRRATLKTKENDMSFGEGYKLVLKFFKSLDKELAEIFVKFFENGQVDVFPKTGKTSGAFCATSSYQSPVFIMLNFEEKISYLRTIVHEFGHAINSELSRRQPPIYFDYGKATAETASTLFEYLFVDFLRNEFDSSEIQSINISSVEDILSTTFRQAAFYDFEKQLHADYAKKGYLSSKEISELFYKNVQRDFGKEIMFDEYSKKNWIYIGHFRMIFYVYSYAFGCLSSLAISQMYKSGELSIQDIKIFLGLGNSKTPKDMFKTIGIDISNQSFWENGVKRIGEMVNSLQ